jgi:hypothetical protein
MRRNAPPNCGKLAAKDHRVAVHGQLMGSSHVLDRVHGKELVQHIATKQKPRTTLHHRG